MRLALFLASFLALAEFFVFRVLLPGCEVPLSLHDIHGYSRFDPSYMRSGRCSNGSIPRNCSSWSINDAGWNSIFQYRDAADRDRPLIAVIGDCGIEGFHADVGDHIDSRLFLLLRGRFDVYAFARHDEPLIELTLLMEWVDSLYRPDAFVMFFSHDVLRQSLLGRPLNEYHFLLPAPGWGTFIPVDPPRWTSPGLARVAMRSALIRYLRLNRGVALFPLATVAPSFHQRMMPLKDYWVDRLLPTACRYLLGRISVLLEDRLLLLVVDDPVRRVRLCFPEEHTGRAGELASDFAVLREMHAQFRGIDYMDIYNCIEADFDSTAIINTCAGTKYLNDRGNFVVACAIARRLRESRAIRSILAKSGTVYDFL